MDTVDIYDYNNKVDYITTQLDNIKHLNIKLNVDKNMFTHFFEFDDIVIFNDKIIPILENIQIFKKIGFIIKNNCTKRIKFDPIICNCQSTCICFDKINDYLLNSFQSYNVYTIIDNKNINNYLSNNENSYVYGILIKL